MHISTSAKWSVHISTLTAIAKEHAGDHTLHYVRKVGAEKHEVLLVPTKAGNLTATAKSATDLSNYLLLELKAATISVEYSGTSPPPSALARTGTAIGWIILITLLAGAGLFVYTKTTGRPITMPTIRSSSVHLPTPIWRQEDLTALRRRAEAPFSGFARFKNVGEGDGVVEIEGLDKDSIVMGSDVMILKPDDLKTEEVDMARSFSNPMFNVEPPSNIYGKEPTEDMTFGVDNPSYVALNEMREDNKDEKESHYETIGNIDDKEFSEGTPIKLSETDLECFGEDLISTTTRAAVEEVSVANDLLNAAETIITEEEKLGTDDMKEINLF